MGVYKITLLKTMREKSLTVPTWWTDKVGVSHQSNPWRNRGTYLISTDFLEGPVDVQQGHMVSFTGDEFFAHSKHLVSACRRVVEHGVHGEQRDNGQNLFGTGEVWRDQDGLQKKKKEPFSSTHLDFELICIKLFAKCAWTPQTVTFSYYSFLCYDEGDHLWFIFCCGWRP